METKNFWVWVLVCIITHMIRTIYEILKHKKLIMANQVTFVVIFTNMALLWTSWFLLCSGDLYKIELPGILKCAGVLLFLCGIVLFVVALLTIKSLESYDGDLITKGIYSKISHPMYLGFILWLIGLPLFFGGLYSMILAIAFFGNILFWKHLEVLELEERFPSYKDYRKKTLF